MSEDYDYPQDALHGAPSAIELVAAVADWLRDDVSAAVEGRLRFHTRVAVNVLDTVRRELELGDAQAAAHRARLGGLGAASERELADLIRHGQLDDRRPEVLAVLRAAVHDKLAVANPRYLGDAAT